MIDIMQEIADVANFSFETVLSIDGLYGSMMATNGSNSKSTMAKCQNAV